MAAREVGAESTSPCTWMKHLPNLLRNKANSQQYPSIYEDRRLRSIEDTKKTDLLQDKKVPGTRAGNRVMAGLLGESRANSSLPCQTRLEKHREHQGLKSQGGE